jgi:arylsulfatase A-like enzyme
VSVNVLWIISDTMRPDCLGVNGGPAHTPNLDELAGRSVMFRHAQASSFPTVPCRGDYVTGKYNFIDTGWGPLPRGDMTVAHLLGEAGVCTVGVVDTPFYTQKGYNYDRGFTYFYDLPIQLHYGQSDARRSTNPYFPRGATLIPHPRVSEYDHAVALTMTTAEKCLEQIRSEQFFLYVDTWDPHEPFDPPPWYVERYRPDYDGRTVYPIYGPYEEFGTPREDIDLAWDCYLAKVTLTDRWIGRLLDRLDTLNLLDTTAIVFSSDHGFYFGEHGFFGKMQATHPFAMHWRRSPLYRELTDIPIWIALPHAPARVDQRLVANIDLAPTVLELAGVKAADTFHGRSLVPLVADTTLPGDDIVMTAAPLAAPGDQLALVDDVMRNIVEWQPITVTSEQWVLVFSRWDDPIELYDRASDPGQLSNVADVHPDVVRDLHTKLVHELERVGTNDAVLKPRR